MLFYPKKYINRIEEITIEFLQKNKIKALILDMDNTLINYKKEMPDFYFYLLSDLLYIFYIFCYF